MKDLFISYAFSDKAFALKLAEDLRNAGIKVWIDSEYLKPGQNINEGILHAIEESEIILVLLSKESINSQWVISEAALALSDENKRVIPIFLQKNIEIPFLLKEIIGIDFSQSDKYTSSLDTLIKAIAMISMNNTKRNIETELQFKETKNKYLQTEIQNMYLSNRKKNIKVLSLFISLLFISVILSVVLSGFIKMEFIANNSPFLYGFLGVIVGIISAFIFSILRKKINLN